MTTAQDTLDLTTVEGVKTLMSSSENEEEWNNNCDQVKAANKGYPDFWYSTVVLSGLSSSVQANW